MIWFNRFHTFVQRLHVNRTSDHQMWKVVVVVVGGGTIRLAPGRDFLMSGPCPEHVSRFPKRTVNRWRSDP